MEKRSPETSAMALATNGTSQQESLCETRGSLLVIGGHEKKEGNRQILEEVARRAGNGKLIVSTIASEEPEPQWEEYRRVFQELGVRDIQQLDVRRREDLLTSPRLELLAGAKVVFFAGGDQLKITSRFDGTPLSDSLRELYRNGATIAGTSSGASVVSDVMMIAGEGDASQEVSGSLRLAPGLGLITGMIIDQHFAQRGRMGRLVAAVARNPRVLGIGIDEDTALLIEREESAVVMGSGAVYFLDGREMTYTNSAHDGSPTMSAFGIRLHVLSAGDRFHFATRLAESAPQPVSQEG